MSHPTTAGSPSLAEHVHPAEGATPRERRASEEARALDELAAGEQALYALGDLVTARAAFERAFELARAEADIETMATAAIGLGGIWVHERRSAVDAADVEARQEISLAALDPESSLALRLRLRLAAEADYRADRSSEVLRLLDVARTCGDPVVLAEALSLAHHCVLGPEHSDMRIGLADELLRVAALTHRPSDTVMGLVWRAADLFSAGERQAERAYAEVLSHEPANRHAAAAFATQAMRVMLTIRSGRLAEAEALAETCARAGAAAGYVDWMGCYAAHLLTVRWYQGRIGELVDTLSNIVNSPTLSVVDHSFVAAQALACAAAGHTRQARGALARIIGRDLAELPTSSSWLAAMTAVIEAAGLLEDHAAAARAYRLLLPFAHLPVMASTAVACLGSAQHPLGVACLVTRDGDRAVEHFEAAVAHNYALGNWPAATLSRHRLAEALSLRGAPGDAKAAADLSAGAATEAAELGMRLPTRGIQGRSGRSMARVWRRSGRHWRIELGGRSAVVEDMVGIHHLATLVANPGVDIPALVLAEPDHTEAHDVTPQSVLDEEALRQYRSRLRELAAQIKNAEASGDAERETALRAEADWLRREVEANTGLGGRSRHFADSSDRARIAVGKAIRRALERISAADAHIGAELRECVETGVHCSYRPSDR